MGGKTVKEAIAHIKEFLLRCRKHNIKLTRRKLQFGMTVKFVAMMLGGHDGYKPLQAKAQAMCHPEALKNLCEVRSVLGLLDGFCNFMPDLTMMMPNIKSLIKKDTAFLWKPECAR